MPDTPAIDRVDRRYARRYGGRWIVSQLLLDRAMHFPDSVVISAADGEVLTYEQLADRAARVAAALIEIGTVPGDRVATMLDPSVTYLSTWFASAWAGCVEVPINTDFKGDFLAHVLRESGASVLVIDGRWVTRLRGLELPDLDHVVVVGSPDQAEADDARCLFLESILAGVEPVAGPANRSEEDLVYVMYTSGTSGPSKGALHSNCSALWNAYAWLDVLDLGSDDVAYSMFPLFHVTARSAVITSTIWAGGSVALRHGFSVTRFWEDVRASRATFFAYMGSVVHLLSAAAPVAEDSTNNVRIAFGAAAPPALVDSFERRFGLELLEVYGSTELGLATAPRIGSRTRGAMGVSCEHLELQIHDECGFVLPNWIDGEIVARPRVPQAIFQGYWGNPTATVDACRNLWFHTGDRGHFRDDGNLVFVDRIKDTIRRRGENISSFEVERTVQQHPAVLEAAAYAVPSEIGEDEVALAVVAHDRSQFDVRDLFQFCMERLPRFAVPRYVRLVDQLPKTPSQRIQKFALRDDGITAETVDRRSLGIEPERS